MYLRSSTVRVEFWVCNSSARYNHDTIKYEVFSQNSTKIVIDPRKTNVTTNDGMWHHICLR